MSWTHLTVASDGTHHTTASGEAAYRERFDSVLKFHAPGLAPVRRENEAWHIHPDGSSAYVRRFVRTFGYYEGLAAVVGSSGWHHVTADGRDAYAERYAWCGNFQGRRCTVRNFSGAYLHIRDDGRPLYAERWRYAGDFRDGVAVVQGADGRSTHLDDDGRVLHGRWFVDLDVFHKAFARARDEDGWTHVDVTGAPVYDRRFAAVEPFYNGQARVERFDGALEVIDESGRPLVELRPPRRSEFAALSGDMVGFWRTQTVATAIRLGVIEALPADDATVAERCNLRPDAARRLLRALGELHLVTRPGEQWALTSRGAFLRAHHPLTLSDAALEYAGPFSRMWAGLPNAAAHVAVLDRSEVIEQARRELMPSSRLEWRTTDIFESWGLEADAVLLSRVLHDWDDDAATRLLRRARACLPLGGRVFIVEMLIPDDSVAGSLCDLHLLMATGGQERSAAEFGRLLNAAGFELAAVRTVSERPAVVVGVAS